MNIKVSVIIPIYNAQKYLEQCLLSVMGQTLKAIEIICVNDGSTDGSLGIVNKLAASDERIRVINQENAGYGRAVNTGIREAKGEYIGIVEADDFIAEDMYEQLYEKSKHSSPDIIKGGFYEYRASGSRQMKLSRVCREKEAVTISGVNKSELGRGLLRLAYYHPSIWSAIYKREFLTEKNIGFIEESGAGWVDNPFLYETLLRSERTVIIRLAYYYYRCDNETSSSNFTDCNMPLRRIRDMLDAVDKYGAGNRDIKLSVYFRAMYYVKMIMDNPCYDSHIHDPEIRGLLKSFDKGIIDSIKGRFYIRGKSRSLFKAYLK